MTKFILIAFTILSLVFGFLAVTYIKDSYQLLPISASKQLTPGRFANWLSYSAPSGKFSISFPAPPQNATQTVKDPKSDLLRNYDMYVSETEDGSIYMVSLIQFPKAEETPEILQKTIISDLVAASPTNQLKSMSAGTYNKIPTVDFVIENPERIVKGRSFFEGNTLYLISTIAKVGNFAPADYDYFIKSFDLKTASK